MEKQLEAIAVQLERNNQLFERWIEECKSVNSFNREHQDRVAKQDADIFPVQMAALEAQAEYFKTTSALNKKYSQPYEPKESS